uniref:Uncharacterized protein n=1 Tax=Ditylenchus dipsaci TaxID=166011 RepID=A0A915DXU5_9BILA
MAANCFVSTKLVNRRHFLFLSALLQAAFYNQLGQTWTEKLVRQCGNKNPAPIICRTRISPGRRSRQWIRRSCAELEAKILDESVAPEKAGILRTYMGYIEKTYVRRFDAAGIQCEPLYPVAKWNCHQAVIQQAPRPITQWRLAFRI